MNINYVKNCLSVTFREVLVYVIDGCFYIKTIKIVAISYLPPTSTAIFSTPESVIYYYLQNRWKSRIRFAFVFLGRLVSHYIAMDIRTSSK